MTALTIHLQRSTLLALFIVLSSVVTVFTHEYQELQSSSLSSMFWMALIFFSLLLSAMLFKDESEDGVIDQWILSSIPLSARLRQHALFESAQLSFCLIPAVALLGFMFEVSWTELASLLLSLLLGLPTLVLFSFLGAALTLKNTLASVLIPIILLPLMVPIVIFGQKVSFLSFSGGDIRQPTLLLLGLGILLYSIMPQLIAFALKLTNGQE